MVDVARDVGARFRSDHDRLQGQGHVGFDPLTCL